MALVCALAVLSALATVGPPSLGAQHQARVAKAPAEGRHLTEQGSGEDGPESGSGSESSDKLDPSMPPPAAPPAPPPPPSPPDPEVLALESCNGTAVPFGKAVTKIVQTISLTLGANSSGAPAAFSGGASQCDSGFSGAGPVTWLRLTGVMPGHLLTLTTCRRVQCA